MVLSGSRKASLPSSERAPGQGLHVPMSLQTTNVLPGTVWFWWQTSLAHTLMAQPA